MDLKNVSLLQKSKMLIIYFEDCTYLNGCLLTPYLRGSFRLDLLDECIWLLPWLRNAICFEIGFVLNLSSRSKGCSMTNHCSRITELNFFLQEYRNLNFDWQKFRNLNLLKGTFKFIKVSIHVRILPIREDLFIYRIILECDSF